MITDKEQQKIVKKIIKEIINLEKEYEKTDTTTKDNAYKKIMNYPEDILIRSVWHNPWDTLFDKEYCIELSDTGIAVRLIDDLDYYSTPSNVEVQYQETNQSCGWKTYPLSEEERKFVMTFVQRFDFFE